MLSFMSPTTVRRYDDATGVGDPRPVRVRVDRSRISLEGIFYEFEGAEAR